MEVIHQIEWIIHKIPEISTISGEFIQRIFTVSANRIKNE
jgi:hypothetical protein